MRQSNTGIRNGAIKQFANELLTKTSFVDVFGRSIGYDYGHILALIKKEFPKSNITIRVLRWAAYELNRDGDVRVPARHRSRTILARDYTRSLLMQSAPTGFGLSDAMIHRRARARFPEVRLLSLTQVRSYMVRAGFKPPLRPPRKTR